MINNPGPTLFSVVPTGSPTKATLLPGSAIPGLAVGNVSTIYVDQPAPNGRGNNATGVRGNEALPFSTLDAALAVMQSGDTIALISGTFAPPSAPVPNTIESGSLVSMGDARTVRIDATGTGLPCFDLSLTAAGFKRTTWLVAVGGPTLSWVADVGAPAIKADGSLAAVGAYFSDALSIGGVLGGAIEVKYAQTVILAPQPVISPDAWVLFNCGQVICVGDGASLWIGGPAALDYTYDAADPLTPPASGPLGGAIAFFGSISWFAGTLKLVRQASLFVGTGVVLPDVISVVPDVGPGPAFQRTSITINARAQIGSFGAGAAFNIVDSPDGVPQFSLAGVEIVGASEFAVAGAAANRVGVELGGAVIHKVVTLGKGVDGSARGAACLGGGPANGLATSGTGTLIPPDGVAIGAKPVTGLTTTIALPWTLGGGGGFTAAVVADNPATIPLAVNNLTATSFDVVVTAAVGNVRFVLSFDT